MESIQQINDNYKIDYSIPSFTGPFSQVFRGFDVHTSKQVAIKRIKNQVYQMMSNEVQVMQAVKHQNVVELLSVVQQEQQTFLVMEYCNGGDLQKELKNGISESDCFKYFKQTVEAMFKINTEKFIHRDLKPHSILLTNEKNVKLAGLGLSTKTLSEDPNEPQAYDAKGTPLYTAPQVLKHQKYSAKCDVWSLGLVLVQILTGVHPFSQAKNMTQLRSFQTKITEQKGYYDLQGDYDPQFKYILSKMLVYEELERWSFSQIKQFIEKNIPLEIQPNITSQPFKNESPLFTYLKQCVEFLYDRGKLFLDYAILYDKSKNSGYSTMVKLLCVQIYLKYLQKIFNLIEKQNTEKLLKSVTINQKQFSLTEDEIKQVQLKYQAILKKQYFRFSVTLNGIYEKIRSSKFIDNNLPIIWKVHNLINKIQKIESNNSIEELEQLFRTFFRQECMQNNYQTMNIESLRIYWMMVTLANLRTKIPLSNFRNSSVCKDIRDHLKNLSVEQIRADIAQMHQSLNDQ